MRRPLPDIWRKRAVNWLSLIMLALVLATFGTYLRERLAESESMAVRVVLNNLRSQLVIEESTARARLEKDSLARRDGANPMEWVEGGAGGDTGSVNWKSQTPESYIGDCGDRQPGEIGVWCFAQKREELRYYPRFEWEAQFERAFDGNAYVWRVEVSERDHLSLVPVGSRGENL